MNAFVTDTTAIRGLLGRREPRFGENAWKYYELCRERDLCLTHTLVDPQIDRAKGPQAQDSIRIVKETDAGLVVRGARMLSTLAPISDELWVGPYMPGGEEDYALCFALPMATSGLKFVCREPYDTGRSSFDRPLSSRFDEGDAIAVFDDVLVPWERVFAARDLEVYNLMGPSFPGALTLQAVVRGTVKLRFLTGLACLVAEAIGRTEMPRYQEMLGELVGSVELAEGLLTASAHDVFNNYNLHSEERDERPASSGASRAMIPGVGTLFGASGRGMLAITEVRLFFPQAMTRAIDTIRLMGSSGLILTPTEKDLAHPDVREVLGQYLRCKGVSAERRLRIMKWHGISWGRNSGAASSCTNGSSPVTRSASRIVYYGTKQRAECQALAQRLLDETA